ncbi:hypothetical protein [Actinoplanes sp. NPDC051851]|uniref:hypothetical protein n=1 Tax=Actinoplanes sp. NPDC051851 TaxID=3154753 RepID=UPI00341B0DA3
MGKSIRQRRAARIAQVLPIVGELTEHTARCDGSWMSRRVDRDDTDGKWLTTPFSVDPRADDALAESNYRVIKADLERVAGMEIDYRIDAWPGGTIHTLTVRADDALALRAVQQWTTALADYPIASESDLSELEAEYAEAIN